jgi:hypothetical protein
MKGWVEDQYWEEPEDYIPDSWWRVLIWTELLILSGLFWGLVLLIVIALAR